VLMKKALDAASFQNARLGDMAAGSSSGITMSGMGVCYS
jgi:hypothetical protein